VRQEEKGAHSEGGFLCRGHFEAVGGRGMGFDNEREGKGREKERR